jgi:excisionase family DNA binding protein
MISPYLTKTEAAEYARCSIRTINRALAAGDLPRYGAVNRALFTKEDLDAWLKGRKGR